MTAMLGRGRVTGGTVTLEEGTRFPDGALVEVRLLEAPAVAVHMAHAAAPGELEHLMEQLISESRSERRAAAEALGHLGDARAAEVLLEAMRDKAAEVREAAEASLLALGADTLDTVIIALVSGDRLREAAGAVIDRLDANWLQSEAARRCVPKIGEVLSAQHGFYQEREMAAQLLGQIGDLAAVPSLVDALSDESRFVRAHAAVALGRLGDRRTVKPLLAALTDQEPGVHEAVASALGMFRADAVELLIDALENRHGMIRSGAAAALEQMADPSALDPLLALLQDDDARVREAAIKAIGKIADARAVEPLLHALNDENQFVRFHATQALVGINDVRVVTGLLRSLEDPHEATRRVAAGALRQLDEVDVTLRLLQRGQKDPVIAADAFAATLQLLQTNIGSIDDESLQMLGRLPTFYAEAATDGSSHQRRELDTAPLRTLAREEQKRRAEARRR